MPRPLVVLVIARCLDRLGAFSMPFLGVHLEEDLGAALGTAGVVLAVFGLATIPSRVLGGALAGRLGARTTMVAGLLACAAAQLVVAAAPTLSWAVLGALLLGLAHEVIEPPSQALVADLVPAARLPAAYALVWGSLAVAGVLAGLLAAATTATVGLRWLFVIDAATCVGCAALVAGRLPADRPGMRGRSPASAGAPRRPAALLLAAADRRLLRWTGIGTGFAVVYMAVVFALPLTVSVRGWPGWVSGLALAVEAFAALAAQPLVPRVGRRAGGRAGRLRAVRIGASLLAIGLLLAGIGGRPIVLVLGLAVVSVGAVLVLANLQAGAAALAPEGARAAYLAVFGLSWGVATTVSPVAVTRLLGVGPQWPWLAGAALALLLALGLGPGTGQPSPLDRVGPGEPAGASCRGFRANRRSTRSRDGASRSARATRITTVAADLTSWGWTNRWWR